MTKKIKSTVLDSFLNEKNANNKQTFLKEWTPEQFRLMRVTIANHFANKYFSGRNMDFQPQVRRFQELDAIMGLAFTSSSSYAGYWVCNDEIVTSKYAGYKYIGFAMNNENKGFAILWDNEEKEIIIPL